MRQAITIVESTALHSDILVRTPSDPSRYVFYERCEEELEKIMREYRSGVHAAQPWSVVPAARIVRIWTQAKKDGFVRDERGLDAIAEQFYTNIVRLSLNTGIAEHGSQSTEDVLRDHLDEIDDLEAFVSWCIDTPGGWRISDYGLPKLYKYAALLLDCDTSEEKLQVCDAIMQVSHQRSDLASWFVAGGTAALDAIFHAS